MPLSKRHGSVRGNFSAGSRGRTRCYIEPVIAQRVSATGLDATQVARELAAGLARPDLVLALVFADWRLDPAILARDVQRACGAAPVVGCTTCGVIGQDPPGGPATAVALGLYGDWIRVGVGLAGDLPKSPLARSRDAVRQAAAALGSSAEALVPSRHVAVTLVDGTCGHEEAFCIGSAAAAPQIRVVGGSAASEPGSDRRALVWARGEALADAGVVLVLESRLPFEAVTSSHLVPTDARTVVTACSGRVIDELDGIPAAVRLRQLVAGLGGKLDDSRPSEFSFARFVDGAPYVRTISRIEGTRVQIASAVEPGHVLRLMHAGDLIGQTRRDLAVVADRVGGSISALLAFSCLARHWGAATNGLERGLADCYAAYPTVGFQSFGEQTGMLLVNYTLTGLAIGARR